MGRAVADSNRLHMVALAEPLRVLTPTQLAQVDRYLADMDESGCIVLIKQKGKLRFVERIESLEAARPGQLP